MGFDDGLLSSHRRDQSCLYAVPSSSDARSPRAGLRALLRCRQQHLPTARSDARSAGRSCRSRSWCHGPIRPWVPQRSSSTSICSEHPSWDCRMASPIRDPCCLWSWFPQKRQSHFWCKLTRYHTYYFRLVRFAPSSRHDGQGFIRLAGIHRNP